MAHPLDPFPRPTRCPSLALARRKCTWQGQPGRLLPPASGELDARYWVPQSLSGRGVGYRKVCLGVALGTAKFVWAARWVPHKLSPRRACVPEVSPKRSVPRNIKYRGPPGCAMHTPLLPGHSLHKFKPVLSIFSFVLCASIALKVFKSVLCFDYFFFFCFGGDR